MPKNAVFHGGIFMFYSRIKFALRQQRENIMFQFFMA